MLTESTLREKVGRLAHDLLNAVRKPETESEIAALICNAFIQDVRTTTEEMSRQQARTESAELRSKTDAAEVDRLRKRNQQLEGAFKTISKTIQDIGVQ